jgi:MurNAc alpha-1-phosphate uridylyltransferase
VSGDIWTSYDYAKLLPLAATMMADPGAARVHLVMVPNPVYHPRGDFVLLPRAQKESLVALAGGPTLTYGNIGIYDSALFRELPRGVKLKLLPLLLAWIGAGQVTGEIFEGPWENVGTPEDLALLNARLAAQGDPR